MKLTFGTVTDRGLNPKRAANEDRLLALAECGLFLVADGVGGRRGGQVASQTAVDIFTEAFAKPLKVDVPLALEGAIIECNRRIFQQSLANSELEGMATTIVALAIDGNEAVIGHVGDSRLYRFKDGNLLLETEDHSEVVEALRAGIISPAMAAYDPMRNVLTRAVGAEPDVEADIATVPLTEGARFLLCTDGITRHIPDSALREILDQEIHPQRICEVLKERCFRAGAEDNLTAVVVDFGEFAYGQADDVTAAVASAPTQGSRIEVDLRSLPAGAPTTRELRPVQVKSDGNVPAKASTSAAGRFARNLSLLTVVVVIGVAIGRYYDVAQAWVMKDLIGARSTNEAQQAANVQQVTDPDLAAARVLFEDKRFEKAREQLAELKRRSPENAEYLFWHGRTEYELKNYAEAIKDFTEAARLDEHLPDVYAHLARAYGAIGDRRSMEETLRRGQDAANAGAGGNTGR